MDRALPETLLERVEALKDALVARATGTPGDERIYALVRKELMANAELRERAPRFLRSCRNLNEFWPIAKERFGTYAERRAWLRDEFDPLLTHLERSTASPIALSTDLALQAFSEEAVRDLWKRMLDRRENDPEGAITAARSLLETVCKHLLDELGEPSDDNEELPALYKAVTTKLSLAPEQYTEQVFKQILGGCATVVNGLAGVRNKLSDAHGKGPRAVRPSARHAELAVNLAGSMAAFLVSTWSARKKEADRDP